MPAQAEPSQSAVDLLDLALGRVEILHTILGDLGEPSIALASRAVLVERAEGCLDDVVGALRSLRVRLDARP